MIHPFLFGDVGVDDYNRRVLMFAETGRCLARSQFMLEWPEWLKQEYTRLVRKDLDHDAYWRRYTALILEWNYLRSKGLE